MMLDLLNDESGGPDFATDLVNSISPRWISLFWGPRLDAHTVLTSIKIYAKLQLMGANNEFLEQHIILSRALQPYFGVIELYPTLLFALCGVDQVKTGVDFVFDIPTMAAFLKPPDGHRSKQGSSSIILPIITTISNSVRVMAIDLTNDGSSLAASESHLILCNAIQTSLYSLSYMFKHFDTVKDALCKQEIMEKIISILMQIISIGFNAMDCGSKLNLNEDSNNASTLFNGNRGNPAENLKLKWKQAVKESESGETSFSIIQKANLRNNQTSPTYLLCDTKFSKWNENDREISDKLIELLMTIVVDSILGSWKPLFGLDIVFKGISASSEKLQDSFTEFLLVCTITAVMKEIYQKSSKLSFPKSYAPILKLVTMATDETFRGTEPLL